MTIEDYIADYINEELEQDNKITTKTIANAFDAYNGGPILRKLIMTIGDYIADYVNEELERNNKITAETIIEAIDAYDGGAAD